MTRDEAVRVFERITHTLRPRGGDDYERYLVFNADCHDEQHQDEQTQGLAEYAPGWEFIDSVKDLLSQELPYTEEPWLEAAIVLFGMKDVQQILCECPSPN